MATTQTSVKVPNFRQSDLVYAFEFEGLSLNGQTVHNHCAPTAGTNIIKYWGIRRGISGLIATNVGNVNNWIFLSLCVNMQTDLSEGGSGTSSQNIYNGLRSYCTATRGVQYDQAAWWGDASSEICTFAKAKNYIDSEVPFIVAIQYYVINDQGQRVLKGHVMACFGYSTGTENKIMVAEKQDGTRGTENRTFSQLDVLHYFFVNWY